MSVLSKQRCGLNKLFNLLYFSWISASKICVYIFFFCYLHNINICVTHNALDFLKSVFVSPQRPYSILWNAFILKRWKNNQHFKLKWPFNILNICQNNRMGICLNDAILTTSNVHNPQDEPMCHTNHSSYFKAMGKYVLKKKSKSMNHILLLVFNHC